jgi:CAAX prenyl protease-like protein
MQTARTGHGWWPYVAPYLAFLGTVEVTGRMDDLAAVGLFLKPAVPGLLMIYFARGGAYPELRGPSLDAGLRLLDVAVGMALAVLWVAPFVFVEAIRPEATPFDPKQLGTDAVALVLGLRMLGYGLVTPFFEEIFIRSFVMRYADVFQQRGDFRDIPLARFTRVSFVTSIVVFTMGHVPWEWWVAVPWVVLTNLWFYYRKDLYAVIVVHAATNASLLVGAWLYGDRFGGANPISLWLFV